MMLMVKNEVCLSAHFLASEMKSVKALRTCSKVLRTMGYIAYIDKDVISQREFIQTHGFDSSFSLYTLRAT